MRNGTSGRYTVRVYSPTGKRLRNCHPARARKLLAKGKAGVNKGPDYFGIILKVEESMEWNR